MYFALMNGRATHRSNRLTLYSTTEGSASAISSSPTDPETAQAIRASRISSGVRAAKTSIAGDLPAGPSPRRADPAMIRSANALCRSCRQATAKRTSGRRRASSRAARDHVGQVARHFLGPRAGQDRHQRAGPAAMLRQEPVVQRPFGQLVEVRMADVNRVRTPRAWYHAGSNGRLHRT